MVLTDTASKALFDDHETDAFGLDLQEAYADLVLRFTDEFEKDLRRKAREMTSNTLFGYGKLIEDPRFLLEAVENILRTAFLWANGVGYVAFSPEVFEDFSEAVESNVIELPGAQA